MQFLSRALLRPAFGGLAADERIKEIQATSWIVASNPGLLEKAGFTVAGSISEEMRMEHFSNESRPVSWAQINREKFLKLWLDEQK